jgi:hypothetical protein
MFQRKGVALFGSRLAQPDWRFGQFEHAMVNRDRHPLGQRLTARPL